MDFIFRLGLIIKGVDAIFEMIGGILLTMPTKLARYILVISQHEAFRHHMALAGKLDKLAETATMHPSMGEAIYLIIHGLSKVILILAIARGKRWGYVGFMAILSLFAAIELVRAGTAREIVTGVFGIFDLTVVFVIYKEYVTRFLRKDTTTETSPITSTLS